MKPIGTVLENRLMAELLESSRNIKRSPRLMHALESIGADLSRCYIVNWIPEQAEDIYHVLFSKDEVAIVEIPRQYGRESLDRLLLSSYESGLTKVQKLKVAAALRLLRELGQV